MATKCLAQPVFIDWTHADSNHVEGMLGDIAVTLVCDREGVFDHSILDGTATYFDNTVPHSYFTPPLALSDVIFAHGYPVAPHYTLTFSRAVRSPIIHFLSLASTVAFDGVQPIVVSGQPTLTVSENAVIGHALGPPPAAPFNDSNGTISLSGVFTSVSFTAAWMLDEGDEFDFQIGAEPCLSLFASPTDAETCPSGTGAFTVSALGVGELQYRWEIQLVSGEWTALGNDPMPLSCPGGGLGFAFVQPVNAASVQIAVRSCSGTQQWPVRCVITSDCDSVSSAAAMLRICPADFNCNGILDSQDFFDFLNAFFGFMDGSDYNQDGNINSQDLFDFLNAFVAGC
jgi:hypothetical protein